MIYVKEELEKMLRKHKKNEARLTEVQLQKEEYQERLYYAGMVDEESDREIIEGMQLSGQAFDGIPSKTNKISDKTASTAMRYKNEMTHINKEDRVYLQRKIIECEAEEQVLNKKIVRVKNLLEALSEKQRFVINEFYILNPENKGDWQKVEAEYNRNHSKPLMTKQLQNIRNVALKDMLEILNTNKLP